MIFQAHFFKQAGINLAVNDGLFQMLFCMGQDRSSQ